MSNNVGSYLLAGAFGGLVTGGIGAYVADSSRSHPVLKGALVAGVLNSLFAAAVAAGVDEGARQQRITSGVSGAPLHLSHPRFP